VVDLIQLTCVTRTEILIQS